MSDRDAIIKEQLLAMEDNSLTGYVPTQKGKVIGKSGVTIAKGFDLGQHSTKDLFRLGIPPETLVKLVPYMGKKGKDAQDALSKQPLSLTADEASAVNSVVYDDQKNKAIAAYENNTGFAWDNLPENVQDALIIQGFNMGEGLYKNKGKETNFTKQLRNAAQNDDYTAPAQNMAVWNPSWVQGGNDGLLKRAKAAADLMAGDISTSDFADTADNYLLKMRTGVTARDYKPSKATIPNQVSASELNGDAAWYDEMFNTAKDWWNKL